MLAAGMGKTAQWSSETVYYPRDTVQYDHGIYMMLDDAEESIGKRPDLYPDIWTPMLSVKQIYDEWAVLKPILEGYQYLDSHNSNRTYNQNNQVLHNGTVYIAKQDVPANIPITNTSYWKVFSAGFGQTENWSSSKAYRERDTVAYLQAVYVCLQNTPSGIAPTNTAYWYRLVSVKQIHDDWAILKPRLDGYQYLGAHNQAAAYRLNNQVMHNGTIYIAKQDVPANTAITHTAYWSVFAAGLGQTEAWESTKSYMAHDTVVYQDAIYVCLQAVAAGVLPSNSAYWYRMLSVKAVHDEWNALKPTVQQAIADADEAAAVANQLNEAISEAEAERVAAERQRAVAETERETFFEDYKGAIENGPVLSVNGQTGIASIEKDDVGLGLVDNTADMDKPVSTAQAEALGKKSNEWIATTSGTGAAYTVTIDPAPDSLYVGMTITIIPHTVSTSTSATLNVNGFGAKYFRQRGYTTGSLYAPYTSSFLTANKPTTLLYDGTYWVMMDYSKPNWYDVQSKPTTFTPTSHASTGTTYGLGTSGYYGHVKLLDSTTSTNNASSGYAATPLSVKNVADAKANYQLIESGDFNSMTTPGLYTMRATTTNAPTSGSYHGLIVLKSDNGEYIQQIAVKESSTEVYVRYGSSGTWQPWSKMALSEEVTAHADDTTMHVTSTEKSAWNGKASASHVHGAITSDGKIGTTANQAVYTGTSGALTAGTLPLSAGGTGATTAAAAPFLQKSGGTMTGTLTANNTTTWSTGYVRNIRAGTAAPTTSTCPLGQIYLQYE